MDYDKAAGQTLRRLRQKYGLTLQEAALHMGLSVSALSRKERGLDQIRRGDIQRASRAYDLVPEEVYHLWMSAGFIPEAISPAQGRDQVCSIGARLLEDLALPAFILDILGYIRIWTHEIEAIWSLSQIAGEHIHLVDVLFGHTTRRTVADDWDAYVVHMIKLFYLRTLHVSNDPTFRELLHSLRRKYGELFIEKWNRAHSEGPGKTTAAAHVSVVVMRQASEYGAISYMMSQSAFYYPPHYDLISYVPSDMTSLERYEQFRTALGAARLYYRL